MIELKNNVKPQLLSRHTTLNNKTYNYLDLLEAPE